VISSSASGPRRISWIILPGSSSRQAESSLAWVAATMASAPRIISGPSTAPCQAAVSASRPKMPV
jgi:hypothetical protein